MESSEQLTEELKVKLSSFNPAQDELNSIAGLITDIRRIIGKLKGLITTRSFSTKEDEIRFFKEIKPQFQSQLIFCKKVFKIRRYNSFRTVPEQDANYERLLLKIEKQFMQESQLYNYWISADTRLDEIYFTRKGSGTLKRSSTGYDKKLSRFIASEMLRKFILQLRDSSGLPAQHHLSWTAPKAGLIELIYALHAAETFNNGPTDIKLIASAFESMFNVNLGNYYRTFLDIRMRKTARTGFLDKLTGKLIHRLEEADS